MAFSALFLKRILKKYLFAIFPSNFWKYSCTLSIFSVVFAHAHVVVSDQNARTIVAI